MTREDMREDDGARLLALAQASVVSGVARRVLHVALSSLPADLARPHHRRLAAAALDPMAGADRAQRFTLANGDLLVVWRGPGRAPLRASLEALAALFAGIALPRAATLCRVLTLPAEAPALAAIVAASARPATHPAASAPPSRPLDQAALAVLEATLAQADVARFVRRTLGGSRREDGSIRPDWEHIRLDTADILAAILPGHAAAGPPALLARLRRALDRRLLALLARPQELAARVPCVLDLSVASLADEAFLRFDAALPAALRGRAMLVLRAEDILADWPAFRFARDFAHARHYRLGLDDPGAGLSGALRPEALGLDVALLRWQGGGAAAEVASEAGRTVLVGADSAAAIAWGGRCGIALFEGRAVPYPAGGGAGAGSRALDRGNLGGVRELVAAAAVPSRADRQPAG